MSKPAWVPPWFISLTSANAGGDIICIKASEVVAVAAEDADGVTGRYATFVHVAGSTVAFRVLEGPCEVLSRIAIATR